MYKLLSSDDLSPTFSSETPLVGAENHNDVLLELYRSKAKNVLLQELLNDALPPAELALLRDSAWPELASDVYQVVIYENFRSAPDAMTYSLADLLRVSNQGTHTFHHLRGDNMDVVILTGPYALERFQHFLKHYNPEEPPQPGSPMDTLFLAYGRPVTELSKLHLSYKDALELMHRRFFCDPTLHTLGYMDLSESPATASVISAELLHSYTEQLVGYLQTFRRNNILDFLNHMRTTLTEASDSASDIKLFLADLYLCIKERIRILYSSTEIPFISNTEFFQIMGRRNYLSEILDTLMLQFDMIMKATENPSRNNVMDDVLYYIDHNYSGTLKLEDIAPLFGYNSAYFGKFFHRTMGKSFHSYVDHIRIERAKELLISSPYKVYEIAERVGYHNVDYFHKKFRKYVGASPAEYRKQYAGEE